MFWITELKSMQLNASFYGGKIMKRVPRNLWSLLWRYLYVFQVFLGKRDRVSYIWSGWDDVHFIIIEIFARDTDALIERFVFYPPEQNAMTRAESYIS